MAKRQTNNWAALELQYVNSSVTYRELAEKHGVKEPTVRRYAERHGWPEKRRSLSQNVAAIAQAKLTIESVDALAEFNCADVKIAKGLRALVAANMAAAQRNSGEISAVELRALAGAAETSQRIGRLALGAPTANNALTGKDGGPLEHANVTLEQLDEAISRVRNKF